MGTWGHAGARVCGFCCSLLVAVLPTLLVYVCSPTSSAGLPVPVSALHSLLLSAALWLVSPSFTLFLAQHCALWLVCLPPGCLSSLVLPSHPTDEGISLGS